MLFISIADSIQLVVHAYGTLINYFMRLFSLVKFKLRPVLNLSLS